MQTFDHYVYIPVFDLLFDVQALTVQRINYSILSTYKLIHLATFI